MSQKNSTSSLGIDLSSPLFANIPLASSPPAGVIPNYVEFKSHAYQVIITVSVCLSLVVFAVLVRLYTNKFITRSIGWDDCKWMSCPLTSLLNSRKLPVSSER